MIESFNTISFESDKSFIMFSWKKFDKSFGVYRISLKFRTLLSNAAIFLMVNDEHKHTINDINGNFKLGKILGDFTLIELVNGRLKYTYGFHKSKLFYNYLVHNISKF